MLGCTASLYLNLFKGKRNHISIEDQQTLLRQKTADAINFANIKAKLQYDKMHKKISSSIENKV